jgi:Xaa-Pro dipeptidase
MPLHFSREEHEQRILRARRALANEGLAALILFAPESHFYLTGYDSVGYLFFQCAVMTTDETPITLLTRRPDLQQARETSIISDIRIWYNTVDAEPAKELKRILEEKGLAGERVGVELDTYGLTGANWERVRQTIADWCHLSDASHIVRDLRLVKSAAEILYVRRAAELADASLLAMYDRIAPAVLESEIAAAGLAAILTGGGDTPPAGPLVNAGRRALYGRSVCGPQRLDDQDQVTVEFAASFHRYNACLMRTIILGESPPEQRRMFEITREAILSMTEAARPGKPIGAIDDAHRQVFDAAGFQVHRYSACGYSLGATYRPSWMDVPPMIFSGNPRIIERGMILFLHAILADTDRKLAMSVGYTVLVDSGGSEVLSKLPIEMMISYGSNARRY